MTATETLTEPTTSTTSAWDDQFAALKARFPKAKDSIVFCVHALQTSSNVNIDDLKAQAAMHGIRVTAASLTAAHKLLAPAAPPTSAPQPDSATVAAATPAGRRAPRAARAPNAPFDVEALIRATVGKLQAQATNEAEHLRAAIRQAIAALQHALG